MNINDRRESTSSGKSSVDEFCYAFEDLLHHLYIEHIARVWFLWLLDFQTHMRWSMLLLTAGVEKICSTMQLRVWYSSSLTFSSLPAIFFPLFISFLPDLFFFLPSFLLFSSYLNESYQFRNYWELATLDPILISTCWIYFLSVTKRFPS